VFSGRIASSNRYDDKKTGFLGSFKTVVEESLETMLIYKYKSYMTNRGGNWKEISYLHRRFDDGNPILKEAKFYFEDSSVTFIPIGDTFRDTYINVPYKDGWIQPTCPHPEYPYKEYDAKIYTTEDYTQKIVPILQHIWAILDKFYRDVIMNPDLDDFNFEFNGVLYKPQKKRNGIIKLTSK
jgi:hypothetical protein